MIVFLLVFSLLIIVHEWGHFFAARKSGVKVEEFGLGLGKKLWGKKYGETEFTLNAVPFGGFVRMLGEEESSDDPRSFEQAKLWKRMWITLNGIFMNLIFTVLALFVAFSVGSNPILLSEADLKHYQTQGFVVLSEPDADGKQIIESIHKIKKPLPEAFLFSISETARISQFIFQKVAEIPSEIMKNKKVPDSLAGPVGIAQATHKILPGGIMAILKLAALLSLSLGLMNLLPIPALDGGRFFFQIIEMILSPFGVKMNPKIENYAHVGGFMFLIGLLLVITGNDLLRLFA